MNQHTELVAENQRLLKRIQELEAELFFLKTHNVFQQGIKGESLVCMLTEGVLTKFAQEFDVVLKNQVKIEVKFSKLNEPVLGSPTRRWNWSKPLGWKDKGKDFDFLLLVGDKDKRYPNQYLDNSPYVYFLVPKQYIPEIVTKGKAIGANVQITTNLSTAKSKPSMAIKKFMVEESAINELQKTAINISEG